MSVHYSTLHHSPLLPHPFPLTPLSPGPCAHHPLSPSLSPLVSQLHFIHCCSVCSSSFASLHCFVITSPPLLLLLSSLQLLFSRTRTGEKNIFLNLVSLDMAFSICLRLLNDLNDWDWDTVHSASLIWTFFFWYFQDYMETKHYCQFQFY